MASFWRSARLMAELALREAVRKRLVAVLLVLSALFLGFYLYGIYRMDLELDLRAAEAGIGERSSTGLATTPVVLATMFGMYLVYFLGSLMSVLSTVGAVSGDIESGVMQSVVARPVSRAGLVAGRWLGFSLVNIGYVSLLSAGLLLGVRAITGYSPPEVWPALGLILLATLLLTGLTVLGSTLFTTLANGIGVFVLYGVGFSGGILSLIGNFSDNATVATLGRAANVVMPTNVLWLGASYHLLPELLRSGANAVPNPLFGTEPAPTGLVLWAGALTLIAVLGGMWRLSRRDL
ncbi:ABC-type transport system involved in multi-copper enzyme maturation, permease component [Deinococcus reticulitermitis]|uniref:ABC-type transport system involved in multi-copper enzyme maturation, permease component n=1 Tax=Deinococcus reticulitermitis TaxID=856736 RepID=A0A1H7B1B1_9DEIO|nr:ABC transporter permease [Deinococcus reticulitermitis]SEJ70674.1 ABC-type transport system involved in multi-copper enzyme maturation, permease component [Deinococcus reticulitermitis]